MAISISFRQAKQFIEGGSNANPVPGEFFAKYVQRPRRHSEPLRFRPLHCTPCRRGKSAAELLPGTCRGGRQTSGNNTVSQLASFVQRLNDFPFVHYILQNAYAHGGASTNIAHSCSLDWNRGCSTLFYNTNKHIFPSFEFFSSQ